MTLRGNPTPHGISARAPTRQRPTIRTRTTRASDASTMVDVPGTEVFPADALLADAPHVDVPLVDAPPPPPPPTQGWAPLPTPGAGVPPPLAWFAEAPSDPNVIIAGGHALPKHYHYRSTDGGMSWKTLHQTSGLLPAVFAPADATIAYALQVIADDTGSVLRVARSSDGGVTWQARGPALEVMSNRIFIDPVDTNKIYVWPNPVDSAQVLSTSNDGGLTWTNSAPLPDLFAVDDMAIAPDEPSRIYAAISGGPDGTWALLTSSNGGASWETLGSGPTSLSRAHRALAIAPSDPNVFYLLGPSLPASDAGARTPGICRSPNRGRTWTCSEAPPGSWQPDYQIDGSLIGVDANRHRSPHRLAIGLHGDARMGADCPIGWRARADAPGYGRSANQLRRRAYVDRSTLRLLHRRRCSRRTILLHAARSLPFERRGPALVADRTHRPLRRVSSGREVIGHRLCAVGGATAPHG